MQDNNYCPELEASCPHEGYALLNSLYDGLTDSAARAHFLEQLAAALGVQEVSIVLYRLEDGASAAFNSAAGEQLFSDASSEALHQWPTPELRHASPWGDLLFYTLDDERASKLAITWSLGSALVQLLVKTTQDVEDFQRQQRELLSYLLPHFASVYAIFLKRQTAAPRLNAIRSLHAMLPLPLVISRRADSSLILNAQALRLVNSAQGIGRSAQLPALTGGWRMVRKHAGTCLKASTGGEPLPLIPLHSLRLENGGDYEVYLLSEAALDSARLNERLLMECFKLTPAEAELCCLALQGRGAQEIAKLTALSINTVKARFKAIYRALGVSSVAQLVVRLYFHPAYWTANHGRRLQAQALHMPVHRDSA